ncbi:outer membrane protein [Alcanivorax sp. NBRC 101098]|jgi:hypothetical protein|nr:outer membrane protein [Alcanivorax sp. NBRC 101098]
MQIVTVYRGKDPTIEMRFADVHVTYGAEKQPKKTAANPGFAAVSVHMQRAAFLS